MDRLFTLDAQFFFDAIVLALSMLVLFTLMSYLLFNPVRDMLEKRKKRVEEQTEAARREKQEALSYKERYERKLREANDEAEQIVVEAEKNAQKKGDVMIAQAREESSRIIDRARAQIDLDKKQALDDMKQEVVTIASMMARKFVSESMDPEKQEELVEQTLSEIEEQTWRD